VIGWTQNAYGWRYNIRLIRAYVRQLLFMDGFGLTNPSSQHSWGGLNYASPLHTTVPPELARRTYSALTQRPLGRRDLGQGDSGGPA
jgi:hypothetical protein